MKRIKAYGYARTSSRTNVGADKDSEQRQRKAIEGFAKANGYEIAGWFYDPAVKGADSITDRPGFSKLLETIAANGVRTIIIESPDRFARDLAVQLAGHDYLKRLGVALIPASAPDYFTEDTPTAVLVRQVLGAIAEFEKATLILKLRAARQRKKAKGIGRAEGRKTVGELRPEVVAMAKELAAKRKPRLSLREIGKALADAGHVTPKGRHYSPSSIQRMVADK